MVRRWKTPSKSCKRMCYTFMIYPIHSMANQSTFPNLSQDEKCRLNSSPKTSESNGPLCGCSVALIVLKYLEILKCLCLGSYFWLLDTQMVWVRPLCSYGQEPGDSDPATLLEPIRVRDRTARWTRMGSLLAVPLSRCPVVPLSRCPVVPLAGPVGGSRWRPVR